MLTLLLPLLVSSSAPALAERTPAPVLTTDVRGFGGPLLGVAQAGDGVVMLTGGRAGLVLADRWVLGLALAGTPRFLGAGAVPAGDEQLSFWQGGVLVQRLFLDGVVRPRVGVLVGAAWLQLERPGGGTRDGLAFAAEPQLGLEVNVARFLRVGLDVGYRLVAPVPAGLRFTQVSGVSGGLTLHFGWF